MNRNELYNNISRLFSGFGCVADEEQVNKFVAYLKSQDRPELEAGPGEDTAAMALDEWLLSHCNLPELDLMLARLNPVSAGNPALVAKEALSTLRCSIAAGRPGRHGAVVKLVALMTRAGWDRRKTRN